jgi:hypothetical protein
VPDEREGLSDERLAEIESRCAAATPEPWLWYDPDQVSQGVTVNAESLCAPSVPAYTYKDRRPIVHDPGHLVLSVLNADEIEGSTADAFFIAHARADVPALLAEVRRLRAVERELRGHVRALVDRVELLSRRAEGS